MTVPFLDLVGLHDPLRDELLEAMASVVDGASFIGGPVVEQFEKAFTDWLGPNLYSVGVGSGTDAIMLAAMSLDLPRGSVAVVPAMTYIATAEGLMSAGFEVELVDVEEGTWVMDPKQLGEISSKTRLIAPVHLYGQMAEMGVIAEVARARKCFVLEDAAQAHGAQWQAMPVGHFSDIACFSFYPGKNLGAFGDAGAVVSRSSERILNCRKRGNHGGVEKYVHEFGGYCSRLDAIQAAVLLAKLKYIDKWNEKRRQVAAFYDTKLRGVAGLQLPTNKVGGERVYHLYVVLVDDREDFIAFLRERGVMTGIHYPKALHQLPAFQHLWRGKKFPNAERLARCGVSLPMDPNLTGAQLEQVVSSIQEYFF